MTVTPQPRGAKWQRVLWSKHTGWSRLSGPVGYLPTHPGRQLGSWQARFYGDLFLLLVEESQNPVKPRAFLPLVTSPPQERQHPDQNPAETEAQKAHRIDREDEHEAFRKLHPRLPRVAYDGLRLRRRLNFALFLLRIRGSRCCSSDLIIHPAGHFPKFHKSCRQENEKRRRTLPPSPLDVLKLLCVDDLEYNTPKKYRQFHLTE